MTRDDSIRIVTWNLWWRFGDWEQRLAAISEVLREADPDICGLQEVWSTDDRNCAQQLADLLGMHCFWCPSPRPQHWQQRLGDSDAEIGNAVLSRWPVTETAHAALPVAGHRDEGRTVVFASVAAPGGPLPFFTTHLNSTPGQSAVRAEQVSAVARFVAAQGSSDFPPVVTGDFNALPESDEVRLMEGLLTAPPVPDLVFVDAWRYAEPDDHGFTWTPSNPLTAPRMEPAARIDFVFVGLPGADSAGHVRSVRTIGGHPVAGVWPSDHAGVLVDLDPGAGQ